MLAESIGQPARFQARDVELKQILDPGKTYEIPMFQRGYAWTNEEVEQLFDDLNNAIKNKEKDYFLGALVLRPQASGSTVVIDGQQRLATLTIILAALRDRLKELNYENNAWEVQNRLIWPVKYGRKLKRILKLREPDDGEFESGVQNFPAEPRYRPHSLIAKAQQVVKEKVAEEEGFSHDRCIDWLNFIEDLVRFVTIEVSDDVSAYTIFETLNDRGLDLAVEDLLRNYLCQKATTPEKAREKVLPYWEDMIRALKDSRERPSVFLRHYWMSRWEPVTKQSLYREYRRHVEENKIDPEKFALSLRDSASIYTDLVEPSKDDGGYKYLINLAQLRATQCLPFLLAMRESGADSKQFEEAARLAEALTVLYSLFGDKNPNRLERKYSEWARAIREGTKTFDTIKKEAAALPDPEVILKPLTRMPPREFSPADARFLLRRIAERKLSGEVEVASPKKVHVDHIVAKHPASGIEVPFSNRLGNLTLILGKWNQEMSNKPFAEKREFYKESHIPMTKQLAELETFGEPQMEEREKEFYSIADDLWHL